MDVSRETSIPLPRCWDLFNFLKSNSILQNIFKKLFSLIDIPKALLSPDKLLRIKIKKDKPPKDKSSCLINQY